MKVDSDPEDDSVLFSCGSSSTAVACAILVLLVFMHLELCSRRFSARRHVGTLGGRSPLSWGGEVPTVDASVFDEFHLKFGQHFDCRLRHSLCLRFRRSACQIERQRRLWTSLCLRT